MPSRAATFPDVSTFRARPYTGRDYRRTIVGGAVLGLSGAGAAAMMAGTAAVAAAWMVSGLLSGNAEFRAHVPMTAGMGLPRPEMRLAASSDMFGGALAATNPAYEQVAVRGDKLAVAAAPNVATATVPLPHAKPRREAVASVPLPQARPMQFAEVEAKLQAEAKPDVARAASAPATPSPRIVAQAPRYPQSAEATYSLASADPAPRIVVQAPRHLQNGEATFGLASGEEVPPSGVLEQAPHHSHSREATYNLASADVVAPATTGSIGAATKPAVALAPQAPPMKPAAPVLAYANPDVPMRDNHTAIYDIVAHVVYMPDGERLEAHSGLGRMLDDPQYASAKARGPTPPNVYDLTLRSGLFHGVQALRLNPVKDSKMYGRDGILAHTYMLGSSGASFGCVSFKHYDAFLQAFRRGEVNRMVVVPHLQEPPPGVRADAGSSERYASNSIKDY
ncbi:MAG: tlde1 domain-containing protein [Xanthobacteraceae bacterium]